MHQDTARRDGVEIEIKKSICQARVDPVYFLFFPGVEGRLKKYVLPCRCAGGWREWEAWSARTRKGSRVDKGGRTASQRTHERSEIGRSGFVGVARGVVEVLVEKRLTGRVLITQREVGQSSILARFKSRRDKKGCNIPFLFG